MSALSLSWMQLCHTVPAHAPGSDEPFTGNSLDVPSRLPWSETLTVPALESSAAVPFPSVNTTIEISAKLVLVSPVLGTRTTKSDVFVETCAGTKDDQARGDYQRRRKSILFSIAK